MVEHDMNLMKLLVLTLSLWLCVSCGEDAATSQFIAGDGGILGQEPGADAQSNASDQDVTDADSSVSDTSNTSPPEDHTNERQVILEPDEISLTDGESGTITFDVPLNAVSVTIIIEGQDRTSYTIGRWSDSEGTMLVRDGWLTSDVAAPQICTSCLNRVASAFGVAAAILPNNEDAIINPGQHTITVAGFEQSGIGTLLNANGTATVSIIAKVRTEAPISGVIDFNFFFTGAGGWAAENAPTDPEFLAVLAVVEQIYEVVGISLGEYTFNDIDPNFRVIENILQDDSDLQEMFRASAGSPEAVNLFFVEELAAINSGGGFGLILGIAGGIPGPPLLQGSTRSGVAIAVDSHKNNQLTDFLPNTVAHEVGHFLGLFHTSEQNLGFGQPELHDPLADTPENDPDWLMHNAGQGLQISSWQGRVMRSNPSVRHPQTQ